MPEDWDKTKHSSEVPKSFKNPVNTPNKNDPNFKEVDKKNA